MPSLTRIISTLGEMKPQLSPSLMRRTFVSSSGEWAWRKADVSEAIAALAADDFAVIGFEAWLANQDGRWTGLLPETGTSALAVVAGDVAKWDSNETVGRYVDRVTTSVLGNLDRIGVERTLIPEALESLHYHLVIERRFPPNQSMDPTLASGTSGAEHQSRHS